MPEDKNTLQEKINFLTKNNFIYIGNGSYCNPNKDRVISIDLIDNLSLNELQFWVDNDFFYAYEIKDRYKEANPQTHKVFIGQEEFDDITENAHDIFKKLNLFTDIESENGETKGYLYIQNIKTFDLYRTYFFLTEEEGITFFDSDEFITFEKTNLNITGIK